MNNINLFFYRLVLYALIIQAFIGVIGCKSTRKVVSSAPNIDSNQSSLLNANLSLLMDKIDSTQSNYKTLSIKGYVTIQTKEDRQKFSYRIHFSKDSLLWGSVGLIGIEGARILITKDSLKYVNKMERKYIKSNFSPIKSKLGLDLSLSQFQQVLIGNVPNLQTSPQVSENTSLLQLKYTTDLAIINFYLNRTNFRLNQLTSNIKNPITDASITYSDFKSVDGQLFPYITKFQIKTPKENQTIFLEHSEIKINPSNLSFSLTIPTDYEEISQ